MTTHSTCSFKTEYTYTVHKDAHCDLDDEECLSVSTSFTHSDLLAPDKAVAIAEQLGGWEEDDDYISSVEDEYVVEVECGCVEEKTYEYAELSSFLTFCGQHIHPTDYFENGVWTMDLSVFDFYKHYFPEGE